jgi:hypothetical protein
MDTHITVMNVTDQNKEIISSDRIIHPKYPGLSILRIIGNTFFIFGYAVILFNSVKLGILFRMIGNLMSFPYFYKVKMWDMMTVRSFFAIIEIVKMIQIIFFGGS